MLKKKDLSSKFQKLMHQPDFLHASYWMVKFLNKFMKHGRKAVVEKTTFHAFKEIKQKTRLHNLHLFLKIVFKFRPLLGFISKRFGKIFKKLPVPLYPRRQSIVSVKWLATAIKFNRASLFKTRFTTEFLDLHAGKKTLLAKRYLDHWIEIKANRLNHRFRWK